MNAGDILTNFVRNLNLIRICICCGILRSMLTTNVFFLTSLSYYCTLYLSLITLLSFTWWTMLFKQYNNEDNASCQYRSVTVFCNYTECLPGVSGVFRAGAEWGGAMVRSPHLWSDREFLDNFCTVFISFVSWLNVKIRVPKLLVTVRVFAF